VRREDILSLTRTAPFLPFLPFRVFVSNGQTFDIHHPDVIIATLGSAHIAVPAPTGPPDVTDGTVVVVSHYHIQKVEYLPPPPAPAGANGAS
jgi:hypothetical protein